MNVEISLHKIYGECILYKLIIVVTLKFLVCADVFYEKANF